MTDVWLTRILELLRSRMTDVESLAHISRMCPEERQLLAEREAAAPCLTVHEAAHV